MNPLILHPVTDLIRKHQLQCDALTEQQFASAIAQALECGDFVRLVSEDRASQAVVYIPFRMVESLNARIAELEQRQRSSGPPCE